MRDLAATLRRRISRFHKKKRRRRNHHCWPSMATPATLHPTMTQDDMNKMLVKILSAAPGTSTSPDHACMMVTVRVADFGCPARSPRRSPFQRAAGEKKLARKAPSLNFE